MHSLVGQTEEKTPLTRPTRRWECNVKTNLKEKKLTLWTRVGFSEDDKEHLFS